MSWTRNEMAARAAGELRDGDYVNLGIGMPTVVADYLPEGVRVTCTPRTACSASDRFRPRPRSTPDLVNAGKQTVTMVPAPRCSTRRPLSR